MIHCACCILDTGVILCGHVVSCIVMSAEMFPHVSVCVSVFICVSNSVYAKTG